MRESSATDEAKTIPNRLDRRTVHTDWTEQSGTGGGPVGRPASDSIAMRAVKVCRESTRA